MVSRHSLRFLKSTFIICSQVALTSTRLSDVKYWNFKTNFSAKFELVCFSAFYRLDLCWHVRHFHLSTYYLCHSDIYFSLCFCWFILFIPIWLQTHTLNARLTSQCTLRCLTWRGFQNWEIRHTRDTVVIKLSKCDSSSDWHEFSTILSRSVMAKSSAHLHGMTCKMYWGNKRWKCFVGVYLRVCSFWFRMTEPQVAAEVLRRTLQSKRLRLFCWIASPFVRLWRRRFESMTILVYVRRKCQLWELLFRSFHKVKLDLFPTIFSIRYLAPKRDGFICDLTTNFICFDS